MGTLERVDVTLHGTELGLRTLQGHFPHLARRDLACLLFCARAEATDVARGQTHSPGQRFAERLTITDRDRGQFAAAVCTARTLRGALLTVAAGKQQRQRFQTRAEAIQAIFEYIEVFYNRTHIHSSIGYVSPVDFERQHSAVA